MKNLQTNLLKGIILLVCIAIPSITFAQTDSASVKADSTSKKRITQMSSGCRMGAAYIVDDCRRSCMVILLVSKSEVPLISPDIISGRTICKEEYSHLAQKDIAQIAATVAGVYVDDHGNISMRGSRFGSTQIYVDGRKIVQPIITTLKEAN